MLLTLPAAVALVVIALPLTAVLFQRGAFGPDDTANTALALAVYGVGLPAFVLHKVLQPLFYAREDTRSPFRYAVVSMVVNAGLRRRPDAGASASWPRPWPPRSSAWVMVLQLWCGARGMGEAARFDARFRDRLPRIVVASVADGRGALAGTGRCLAPLLGSRGWRYAGAWRCWSAIGIVSYFGTGALIGAFRLSRFPQPPCAVSADAIFAITRPQPPGLTTKDSRNPVAKPARSATQSQPPPNSRPNTSWMPSRKPISVKARYWFAPVAARLTQSRKVKAPISP